MLLWIFRWGHIKRKEQKKRAKKLVSDILVLVDAQRNYKYNQF